MKRPHRSPHAPASDAGGWLAFAAAADALATRPDDAVDAVAIDQLERLSDPVIHLASLDRITARPADAAIVTSLALDECETGGRPARLTDAERRALRERILAALHAQAFRLRAVAGAPPLRVFERPQPLDEPLLREAERQHEAPALRDLAVAAGGGRELTDTDCDAVVPLPPDVPRGQYLALRVAGDSMEPLMHAGDTVLVKLHAAASEGDVVVARDPEHGYVVKTLGPTTRRGIELRSLNPAYPPMTVPRTRESVLGVVILRWCAH